MSQATIKQLDRDKILQQIARLPKLAEEKQWRFDYDAEIDELVFGLQTMPDGSFLFNVNDEINLFLTPDSEVQGIFIEYFKSNYIQHNKDLEPVLEVFEDGSRKKVDEEKDELAIDALEGKLLSEAMQTLLSKDKLVAAYI
jgi:hypothetical protein